jgi:hypothetical protein
MNRFIKLIFFVPLTLLTIETTGQTKNKLQFTIDKYLSDCVLNIQIAPAFTKLNGEYLSNDLTTKAGFSVGGDLTYYFRTYGKLKTGISAGLSYSLYRSEYNLDYRDSVSTTDIDNESVIRYEKADNLKEKESADFIDVPLLFHADYTLSNKFDIYVKAGICYSFVVNAKYSSSATYTARGYYPKYNVTLYNIDIPGSPYFYPTEKNISDENKLKLKNNFAIPLALGVKYKLGDKIALTAGINKMLGLRNISDYDNSVYEPIVNDNGKFRTLMHNNGKVKANAFCIELGVSLCLWNE